MNVLFFMIMATIVPIFGLWIMSGVITKINAAKARIMKYLYLFYASMLMTLIVVIIFPNQVYADIQTRMGVIVGIGLPLIYQPLFCSKRKNYAAIIICTIYLANIFLYGLYIMSLCYGVYLMNTKEMIISLLFTLSTYIIIKYESYLNDLINKSINCFRLASIKNNIIAINIIVILRITNKYKKALLGNKNKANKVEKTYLFYIKYKK